MTHYLIEGMMGALFFHEKAAAFCFFVKKRLSSHVESKYNRFFLEYMEFTGKIIAVMPLVSGQGRNGEWKRQEYVVENHDQYPRKMCFNVWGDRIDTFALKEGEEVTVSFDIDAREWNGRWFNDIRAWKVDRVQAAQQAPADMPGVPPVPNAMPADNMPAYDSNDDLPF